jgi:ribose/xylose/arabinose/galactoside ABC-type transport system permease subunit
VPAPIWIMIIAFGLGLWLQRWTYFGRDVYAVGGSLKAARLSGVRTTRTLIIVYGISAFCATIAGISLVGGSGGVGGTILGVIFLGMLQNGLSIAGVPSFWQQVVTGIILVLAVLGDQLGLIGDRIRRRGRRGAGGEGEAPPAAEAAEQEILPSTAPER